MKGEGIGEMIKNIHLLKRNVFVKLKETSSCVTEYIKNTPRQIAVEFQKPKCKEMLSDKGKHVTNKGIKFKLAFDFS